MTTLWEKIGTAMGALALLVVAAVVAIGTFVVMVGVPLALLALFIALVKFLWVRV